MTLLLRTKLIVLLTAIVTLGMGCATAPSEDTAPAVAAVEEAPQTADSSVAIDDAKAAIAMAKSVDGLWRDTEKFLKQAIEAAESGDHEKANRLANKAREQAELGYDQAQREAEAFSTASEEESSQFADSEAMYTVVGGDNLWSISAKDEIYGNPYQWPLIYKQNRDQIKDADLIYPGQEFSISKNPSMGEVDAAVEHARRRGAWSVGAIEASDLEYLNQ